MTRILARLALICVLLSLGAAARATDCPSFFLNGQPPKFANAPSRVIDLCNEAYAVEWSPVTRDPIWSAEHLTPESITKADKTTRLDAFHADSRLPKGQRAELSDYANGPFDRGHLSPAHDMPNAEAMHESFLLSNMAPQVPAANRGKWAQIEEFVRRLVILNQGAYVVTLLAFDDNPPMLNGRVAVPSAYIKALYVEPNAFAPDGLVGAYMLANANDAEPKLISLNAVRDLTGVDPMPSLSADDHARVNLPEVAGH